MRRTPAVVLMLAAGMAFAQPAAKERVAVTLVEVPVTVVDRSGAPVRGLTRENFELADEGKKREITHFEVIDLQRLPPATEAPLNPAARRNFLLLFDLSHSSPPVLLRSREAAREFILKQLGPHDLAAVATWSVEQGFKVVASFSLDREMLAHAIDTLGHPKFFRAADPLLIAASSSSPAAAGGGGPSERSRVDIASEIQSLTSISTRNDADYRRGRIRQQIGSLASLARILDSIRGRKQVILLSEGFDIRLVQGREQSSSAGGTADVNAVMAGEIWNVDSDAYFGSASGTSLLSGMGEIFKRSDVTMHTLDIKGLRGSADLQGGLRGAGQSETRGSDMNRGANESLFLLANETGGQFFKNANDLQENFAELLRRQEVIYILGFQASAGDSPGKFHNLKVRLHDVPRGARASHRAGYFAPDDSVTAVERSLELVEIMMNDIPVDDLDLDLLAAPFPTREVTSQVPVVLEVAGPRLLQGASGHAVAAEVFVYAFDQNNKVQDFLHQRVSLDVQKTGDTLRRSGVKYYGVLALPPGTYAVKSVVRTTSGTELTGFKRTSLIVPDFAHGAVLPPFFVEEGESWVMVKTPPRRTSDVDYPFVIGSESFVPAVEPQLRRDRRYELALVMYNLPAEDLQLGATIDGGGASVRAPISLAGRTAKDEFGGTRFLLELDPAALQPGSYVLNVTVTPAGGASHRVATPFTVQ